MALLEKLRSGSDPLGNYVRARYAEVVELLHRSVRSPARMQFFVDVAAGKATTELDHPMQSPGVLFIPRLRCCPVYETGVFPWTATLPRDFEAVRREVDRVEDRSFSAYTQGPGKEIHTGSWDVLPFFSGNFSPNQELELRAEENRRRCPEIAAMLAAIPRLQTRGCLTALSALEPGAYIKPHNGLTNARLRCHFGIRGTGGCTLRVGPETRSWREGEWLVFDDSFEHEVWHRGDARRIVLIIDVWHPDLADDEVEFLESLQTALFAFYAAQPRKAARAP